MNPYAPIAGVAKRGARRSPLWLLPSLPLYVLSSFSWLIIAIEAAKELMKLWPRLSLSIGVLDTQLFSWRDVVADHMPVMVFLLLVAWVVYGLWFCARWVHRGLPEMASHRSPFWHLLSFPVYLLSAWFGIFTLEVVVNVMRDLWWYPFAPGLFSDVRGTAHFLVALAASAMLAGVGYGLWRVARRIRCGKRLEVVAGSLPIREFLSIQTYLLAACLGLLAAIGVLKGARNLWWQSRRAQASVEFQLDGPLVMHVLDPLGASILLVLACYGLWLVARRVRVGNKGHA